MTRLGGVRVNASSLHGGHTLLPLVKVIYHPLHGMNSYVLIWGDWHHVTLSHDSQSPHIWGCDPLRGSHNSQSPHIRKHLFPILWEL